MKREDKGATLKEEYRKMSGILIVCVIIAELLLPLMILRLDFSAVPCLLYQSAVMAVLLTALYLMKKMLFAPMMDLEGKLMQLYANVPVKYRTAFQGDTFLTEILEDILAYQEQLINTELLSKYLLKESELSALQSQINPHFLFNTLESIRGCAYQKGVPEIAKIIEAMSSLFRSSIQQGKKMIPLHEELDNVNNYVTIQQFRFPGRFEFCIHIDQEDTKKLKVPNLIIQPIVENAIFHGVETKPGGGKIVLDISVTERRVIIRVTDNGVGIPNRILSHLQSCLAAELPAEGLEDDDADHIGIGILNIHRRIRLQFGWEYGITVASTVNVGTEVESTLPVLLEE